MLKQVLVSFLLATLFTSFAFGKTGYPLANGARSISDTTVNKKDSLAAAALINTRIDPKQGLTDLFISSSTSNSINIEQLNPMAVSFVEDYMEKFGKSMQELKDWGRPYFDMMDGILAKYGIPKELKYLAVIESQLKSNARSWAGAVGPWQFMPTTARTMGLRITRKYDERRDLNKSTHAASRYLNSLFEMYGDWLLVIAAYNGGPGKVNAAIKKSGSRDFWVLQRYLPVESRNHVKKFIATHYIMEGNGSIATLTKQEAAELLSDTTRNNSLAEIGATKMHSLTGRYHSSIILKHISMDIALFNKINPDFDKSIAINGKYELRLPADKMDIFLQKKNNILDESLQLLLNPATAANASSARL